MVGSPRTDVRLRLCKRLQPPDLTSLAQRPLPRRKLAAPPTSREGLDRLAQRWGSSRSGLVMRPDQDGLASRAGRSTRPSTYPPDGRSTSRGVEQADGVL